MIREINNEYKSIRQEVRKWGDSVEEFNVKVVELKEALDRPFDKATLMEMAKFAEALPSEIRELQLYATHGPSHVNGDAFRQCVCIRSNNGYIELSPLNKGRELIHRYYELATKMIKYTLEELNRERTEVNSHKAVCLSRDVARFHAYINRGIYEPIEWAKLEPEGDYLTDMYSLESTKEALYNVSARSSQKGVYFWSLSWDAERLMYAVNALQSLVERITEFGIARLELTPEQLDALENK
ncbi:hypothetical protein [Photobacterium phage PDCC-1]|uniref:Uncharacterized protein n=1 Tax=Photobacterium phage PDCC-1 TaxID=2664246 RepID=A0A6B9J827_9CAUD|nr:hypothetical protein HWC77_gp038 [Photobacterium phage PDCC-1]QGZ14401.1 hypothetical protein [Photobacterium phage PDCC-1]